MVLLVIDTKLYLFFYIALGLFLSYVLRRIRNKEQGFFFVATGIIVITLAILLIYGIYFAEAIFLVIGIIVGFFYKLEAILPR